MVEVIKIEPNGMYSDWANPAKPSVAAAGVAGIVVGVIAAVLVVVLIVVILVCISRRRGSKSNYETCEAREPAKGAENADELIKYGYSGQPEVKEEAYI
jgi:uncharacterized membrane protein